MSSASGRSAAAAKRRAMGLRSVWENACGCVCRYVCVSVDVGLDLCAVRQTGLGPPYGDKSPRGVRRARRRRGVFQRGLRVHPPTGGGAPANGRSGGQSRPARPPSLGVGWVARRPIRGYTGVVRKDVRYRPIRSPPRELRAGRDGPGVAISRSPANHGRRALAASAPIKHRSIGWVVEGPEAWRPIVWGCTTQT